MSQSDGDREDRWLTASLARPLAPLSPDTPCGRVYEMMAQDESLFALAVVVDGAPIGLVDHLSMMSDFARQYWREIYARRPITHLMDGAPLTLEAAFPIEVISLQITLFKRRTLNSGFVVVREGRYVGVGSSLDLLKLVAERACDRAQSLEMAQQEIRALNEGLEHRIEQRTAELRAAQEELVRKERFSAIGQLTATVAHELRNPLSSIRNSVFTMREGSAVSSALERPIARIERSIARCDRIIGDLLDFTRLRERQAEIVTADDWLGEVLDEQPLPPGVSLVRRFGAAGYRLNLDRERMRQVIVNLIENAVQAMVNDAAAAGGGTIVVGTRVAAAYEMVIDDTGPGISPQVLPKVFEPLFTTKSFGTGLGLPTVKQIIEQHAGTIAIESELGRGTRVIVRLPLAPSREAAA
jgi:signal transduction histidine kinase